VVSLKFPKKLEFSESLPITGIEKVDDVLIIYCSNGFVISMNEESLALWGNKESCYFFREDGEWNPMMSVDMTKSKDCWLLAFGALIGPNPPQQKDRTSQGDIDWTMINDAAEEKIDLLSKEISQISHASEKTIDLLKKEIIMLKHDLCEKVFELAEKETTIMDLHKRVLVDNTYAEPDEDTSHV
jgi:hypothetical protein